MIAIFLDKDFKGLQNNASLVVDKNNFKLIKRPIETNTFSCYCEAFTEDIQPTFVIIKDDLGRNVLYSALAGVPEITQNNKTRINASDLKTLLSSDVILDYGVYTSSNTIGDVLGYIFTSWNNQVNKNTINYEVVYINNADEIELNYVLPAEGQNVYDALEEVQSYLTAYNLYIDTEIDLINKKVVFKIGKLMLDDVVQNIKLWEYDKKNYGKWVADINETQGYYVNGETWTTNNIVWILTKNNEITANTTDRDIYPIKRRIYISNTSLEEATKDAVVALYNSRYNENIEIPSLGLKASFETKYNIYLDKTNLYKSLPCGELRYNYNGLYEIQIGFRYTTIDFI